MSDTKTLTAEEIERKCPILDAVLDWNGSGILAAIADQAKRVPELEVEVARSAYELAMAEDANESLRKVAELALEYRRQIEGWYDGLPGHVKDMLAGWPTLEERQVDAALAAVGMKVKE